jgi:hypothetical protein
MKKLKIILFFLIITSSVFGQFKMFGDATELSPGTFRLTRDDFNLNGSVWYPLKSDLNKDFTVSGQMYFGNREDGADGVTFVFKNDCLKEGSSGGGIGYKDMQGLSLGIEFDTYQNILGSGVELNNDPVYDHIGIQKNGNVSHDDLANVIVPPVQASASSSNIEDGVWHDFQISYNATTHLLTVHFDNELRISTTYDIVNDALAGSSDVYWGFTSSTGGSSAPNSVKIAAEAPTKLNDLNLCNGYSYFLDIPELIDNWGNIAYNKPIYTSSGGNEHYMVDGNPTSRWESLQSDPQWVYVDLLDTFALSQVQIYWEVAAALDYEIQISLDGTTWTTAAHITDGVSGEHRTINISGDGRYVRMYGNLRTTGYGYSIWEFEVYGQAVYTWNPTTGISYNDPSSFTFTPTTTTTYTLKVPDKCNGPSFLDSYF